MRKKSINAAKNILINDLRNLTKTDYIFTKTVRLIAEKGTNDPEENEKSLLEITAAYCEITKFLQKIIEEI